jgi:uncharacterized protein (DUF2237 family)
MKNHLRLNIFNEPLEGCCEKSMTGFFRDGFCRTGEHDFGRHVVCAHGNDNLKFLLTCLKLRQCLTDVAK